jgi:AcrR family transcriptional regulator
MVAFGRKRMSDQLSAEDWLDQGLRTLAEKGFTALKAEPLSKAMGVSRGSFYWHFADISAFHAALLQHWREIATEQIIATLESGSNKGERLRLLLQRVFSANLTLENAVRTWATLNPAARSAVQAIDRRRLGYIESLLSERGLSSDVARARAQVLYWAFLGFVQSDKQVPPSARSSILEALLRIAR